MPFVKQFHYTLLVYNSCQQRGVILQLVVQGYDTQVWSNQFRLQYSHTSNQGNKLEPRRIAFHEIVTSATHSGRDAHTGEEYSATTSSILLPNDSFCLGIYHTVSQLKLSSFVPAQDLVLFHPNSNSAKEENALGFAQPSYTAVVNIPRKSTS